MFTQNFAASKWKRVGPRLWCIRRSVCIPMAEPCFEPHVQCWPVPASCASSSLTCPLPQYGVLCSSSIMKWGFPFTPSNTCGAVTVTHGTLNVSFCGRNILKHFWNTVITLAVDWPVCGYWCIHTLATTCLISVEKLLVLALVILQLDIKEFVVHLCGVQWACPSIIQWTAYFTSSRRHNWERKSRKTKKNRRLIFLTAFVLFIIKIKFAKHYNASFFANFQNSKTRFFINCLK